MTRVLRGYIARRRRTKMRSFASNFRGAHLRLNRMITQQVRRAFVSSDRDRGRKKRHFRRLWITQINVATWIYKVFDSYTKLIHNLYKKELIPNRNEIQIIFTRFPIK